MENLKKDPKAFEYYNEIKDIKMPSIKRHISDVWSMKKVAEYFFDEMDYFDNSEATIHRHIKIISERFKLVTLVVWASNNNWFSCNYDEISNNKYIELWKKMFLDVDKTTIWIENYYGIRIRCAGDSDSDSVNLKHNIDAFNKGYMTNIINLARKQLETIIETKRIQFQIALTKAQTEIFKEEVLNESKRLSTKLDEHIQQYSKMKTAFEESQLANKALTEKVEAQDILIKELNTKMNIIIEFFGWFKEDIPKQMLRSLTDRCVSLSDI